MGWFGEDEDPEADVRRHLTEVIGRHMPNANPEDYEILADVVLGKAGDERDRRAILHALDEAIVKAAQGHAEGISESERQQVAADPRTVDPYGRYVLGPGDQKLYAALRDSNLVNAAAGRQLSRNPRGLAVEGAKNYEVGEDGEPIMLDTPAPFNPWTGASSETPEARATRTRAHRMREAANYYTESGKVPTQHSRSFESLYPQHAWTERAGNYLERGGDGDFAYALGMMNLGPEASKRATRQAEPDLLVEGEGKYDPVTKFLGGVGRGIVNTGYKWLKNMPSALSEASAHEHAKLNATAASRPVLEGLTKDEREANGALWGELAQQTKSPTIQEYGASRGTTYSPAWGWAQDMMHEIPGDASTLASVVTGGVTGVLSGAAKAGSRGVFSSLVDEVPKVVAREAVTETANPINAGIMGVTFPFDSRAFTAPKLTDLEGPLGQPGYPQVYKQQEQQREDATKMIRELQGRAGR